jgi:hypothetical protein
MKVGADLESGGFPRFISNVQDTNLSLSEPSTMAANDHWKSLPALPEDISSAKDGQYVLSCTKESDLGAADATYQYSTWFSSSVRSFSALWPHGVLS